MGWIREQAQRLRTREGLALVAILLASALVRGVYLSELTDAPDFAQPALDAQFNDHWARSLAFTDFSLPEHVADPGFSERAYLRPPGYPYFLAGTYSLFGAGYLAPRVLQMLFGLAAALLAYSLARACSGPLAGLLAAAGVGFDWVLIYFEGELHEPALLLVLVLACLRSAVAWATRPSLARAAAAGAFLGLGALVRANVLLFVPVLAVWMVWVAARGFVRASGLRHAGTALVASVLAVLPATLRNAAVTGELVPVSVNAGLNLYLGNHSGATGLITGTAPGLGVFKTFYDYPAIRAALERDVGRALTDAEASGELTSRALDFVREQPAEFLALTLRKATFFWGPVEIPHNKQLNVERDHSSVLRRLPGSFAILLGGALLGLVRAWRSARQPVARLFAPLGVGYVAGYFLSVLPFFAAARYRVAVVPVLVIFAAIAAARLVDLARARQGARALGWAAAWALLATLASFGPELPERNVLAWRLERGRAYFDADDLDRARGEFERALAIDPGSAAAHYELGVTRHAGGQLAAAADSYREVVRLEPGHAKARNNLGFFAMEAGLVDEAIAHYRQAARSEPGLVHAQMNLGLALLRRGDGEGALEPFRRVVELDPGSTAARRYLAQAYARAGRAVDAERELVRARELDPGDAGACRELAWLLATTPDAAVRDGARALELARQLPGAPGPDGLRVLGAAHAELGEFERAIEVTERALRTAVGDARGARRLLEDCLERYRQGRPYRTPR